MQCVFDVHNFFLSFQLLNLGDSLILAVQKWDIMLQI